MIILKDNVDIIKFSEIYVAPRAGFYGWKRSSLIKWNEVAQKYCGIEISNYHSLHSLSSLNSDWLDTWDISSGCIWDKEGITKIIKIRGGKQ
jgi:hypothetical protein